MRVYEYLTCQQDSKAMIYNERSILDLDFSPTLDAIKN